MTVVDASAILAVLLERPGSDAIERELLQGPCIMSAATRVELGIAVEARTGAAGTQLLEELLARVDVRIAPVDEIQAREALACWRRFGEGRHEAALNFGDTFAYALAQQTGQPLLHADGVAQTDDELGRFRRVVGAARTAAKQAADATVAGSRRASEAAGTAAASTARVIGEGAKKAAAAGASAGQSIGKGAEKALTVGASAAQAISDGTVAAATASGRAAGDSARWVREVSIERSAPVLSAAQALAASDLSSQINNLVAAAVKGSATIYDKAMDAVFLETHIGGSYHRLFDGGHTIVGAFKAAHDASPDDTLIQEALGAIQGLLRDGSTPRGLPLANWDKGTFDAVADSLQSTFGIPKSWFYDLNTYDIGELLSGTVGVVSLVFGWNKADTETFASLAASIGLSTAVSANPLLMPVSVVALARAFHKAISRDEYAKLAEGGLKGAFTSGSSLGAIALVGVAGGPAGVAMLAGVTAGVLAHAVTKSVTLEDISKFVKEDATTVVRQAAEQAIAIGDAIGDVATDAGRSITSATVSAAKSVASSTAAAGRLSANQTGTATKAAADAARAAARAAAENATTASTAVGSAAQRAREFVGRNDADDAEVAQPDTSDG